MGEPGPRNPETGARGPLDAEPFSLTHRVVSLNGDLEGVMNYPIKDCISTGCSHANDIAVFFDVVAGR